MKILLLNYNDAEGGAAIATMRLLSGLQQYGIDAGMGVLEKKSNNSAVILLKKQNFFDKHIFLRIIKEIYYTAVSYLKRIKGKLKLDFQTSNPILHSENKKTKINIEYINNSDYDLIHLHWINNDMISIEDIAKIKKQIVWTMHDSWVFCGAEHHPNVMENDGRFVKGYTRKNKPETTRGPDICRKTWVRKKKAWKNCGFYFISPSNYEKESLEKSALFSDAGIKCAVIPNIIPSEVFRPLNKNFLKEIYQIPFDRKVIGFGAAYNVNDKKSIKGGPLLLEALNKIKNPEDYYCVIFGNTDDSFANKLSIPAFLAGFISNPNILASLYNLCDVVVCPSLVESFGLVCLESLFCGVPVAAFDTGGIPDIVEHKRTGYLAKRYDTDDLHQGILYCVEHYEELSKNALIKAKKDFDNAAIVKKHIELYKSVINSSVM